MEEDNGTESEILRVSESNVGVALEGEHKVLKKSESDVDQTEKEVLLETLSDVKVTCIAEYKKLAEQKESDATIPGENRILAGSEETDVTPIPGENETLAGSVESAPTPGENKILAEREEPDLSDVVPTSKNEILSKPKIDLVQRPTTSRDQNHLPKTNYTLLNIPELVVLRIYSYLNIDEKKIMCLVGGKQWRQVLEEDHNIAFRAVVSNASYFAFTQAKCLLESVVLHKVNKRLYRQPHQNSDVLRILNAEIESDTSSEVFESFLNYGTGLLQSLSLSELNNGSDLSQILSRLEFANLTKLTLAAGFRDSNYDGYTCSAFFKYAKLPKIKSLGFEIDHVNKSEPSLPGSPINKLHLQFYGFVTKHCKSLTSLSYTLKSCEKNKFNRQEIPKSLMNVLPGSTIHEFSLETGSISAYNESMRLLLTLGSRLTKLKLYFYNIGAKLTRMERLFGPIGTNGVLVDDQLLTQIFDKHRHSLEEFEIGSEELQRLPIDLSFLQGCDRLQTLSLRTTVEDRPEQCVLPSLKSFCSADYSTSSFIRDNKSTIEHLTCQWMRDDYVWPNVKSLDIVGVTYQSFQSQQILFPELIKFRTNLYDQRYLYDQRNLQTRIPQWMCTVMPSLKVGQVLGMTLDLPTLKILRTMICLQKFGFSKTDDSVKSYCKTQGLRFKKTLKTREQILYSEDDRFWEPLGPVDKYTYEIIFN